MFYCQDTGPGGVGDNSNNIIWLDASSIVGVDNDPVASWADVSGNANDFSQSSASRQPKYFSSIINGKPVVRFDGTDTISVGAIAELNQQEFTWFLAAKSNDPSVGTAQGLLRIGYQSKTDFMGTQYRRLSVTKTGVNSWGTGAGISNKNYEPYSNAQHQLPFVLGANISYNSGSINSHFNGDAVGTGSSSGNTVANHMSVTLGYRNAFFNGDIAEVIIFNEMLNSAQYRIINNYLAAKYNITLTGGMSEYAYGSSHSYDVAGIGSEGGANVHLSARGTGIVSMTAASLVSSEYIMWGHDNGGTTTTTANTPASYTATNGERLLQEWRLTESMAAGTITIDFDITGIQFGLDTEYELLVDADGDGDFSNSLTFPGITVGTTVTFTLDETELLDGARFTLGNTMKTIISVADGNWNLPATWSCTCVPTNSNNVVVDDDIVTVSDAQTINDLSIEGTGQLIFSDGADLEITGDVSAVGSFSINAFPEASIITLNGSAAQTLDFSGTITFDSLKVNNNNGVTLNSGTFEIRSALYPTAGNVDFNGNFVRFLSNANGTASIGEMGGTISGLSDIECQRFVSSGVAGWTEFGFPFDNDCDFTEWDGELFMSGPYAFADGCAYGATGCFRSVKFWDRDAQIMRGVDHADSTVQYGYGFDIYLGNNLNVFSAATLTIEDRNLKLDASPAVTIVDGWNFIANPVLAPIDWDGLTLGGSIQNYYWIWSAQEGWIYYDADGVPDFTNSANANMAEGIISPYQGFWVFKNTTGIDEDITFEETAKRVEIGDGFQKNFSVQHETKDFTITVRGKKEGMVPSRVYLGVDEARSISVVPALPVMHEQIGLFLEGKDSKLYSSTSLSDFDGCEIIPLKINLSENGIYDLSFSNIPNVFEVVLLDRQTGVKKIISDNEVITQFIDQEDEDRFVLYLKDKGLNTDCDTEILNGGGLNIYSSTQGIQIENLDLFFDEELVYNIYDISGKMIYSEVFKTISSKHTLNPVINNGTYIVEVSNKSKSFKQVGKVVVIND